MREGDGGGRERGEEWKEDGNRERVERVGGDEKAQCYQ